jgi:large subunit ribosomal protein L18
MIKRDNKRVIRHRRVRAKIIGTKNTPRLSVFRSNAHIFAQLIDDENGKTIAAASDVEKGGKKTKAKSTKVDSSKKIGLEIAKKASEKGIKEVVFDRGGYKYHGRIKALAEGAREGGLKF